MRTAILFFTALVSILPSVHASDMFETNFDRGVRKAEAKGKLIYLHLTADWSAPCQFMEEHIFPQNQVIDFYEKNFICLRAEVDSKEGIEIISKYQIKEFPTHLFLDSKGSLVHRSSGALEADEFIDLGKKSLLPAFRLKGMHERFEQGERNSRFIENYLHTLREANMPTKAVFEIYWHHLSSAEKLNLENFEMMEEYIEHPNQPSFIFLGSRLALYSKDYGIGRVDKLMIKVWKNSLLHSVYQQDSADYLELEERLIRSGHTWAPMVVEEARLEKIMHKGQWSEFVPKAARFIYKYHIEDPVILNSHAWMASMNVTDKDHLVMACAWAEEACNDSDSYFFYETYARLLFQTDQLKKAYEVSKKAIKLAEKQGTDPQQAYDIFNRIMARRN